MEKSQEAIEIYALADRLRMNLIKWELEDIAHAIPSPDAYYQIVQLDEVKREKSARPIFKKPFRILTGLLKVISRWLWSSSTFILFIVRWSSRIRILMKSMIS